MIFIGGTEFPVFRAWAGAMSYIILVFGVLTFLAGLVIIIKPGLVYDFLGSISELLAVHVSAAAVRVIIGVALLSCSAGSRYPVTLQVIGWTSLISAVITVLMGRKRFIALIGWAVNVPALYKRMGGFAAMLLGGFFCYAVL